MYSDYTICSIHTHTAGWKTEAVQPNNKYWCGAGSLPAQVKLDVISTDIILKGDQSAPQTKPAIVGSGRKIMVPQFVAPGESILVDTRTSTFVKRAK